MRDTPKFLKPNVVFEPLIDRWYAWPHLVHPATHAMNIAGRQLKIMGSYIQAPQIHAAAVKNPKMRGGPFMDLGGGRVDEVRALRDETLETQAELLKLAAAIRELDQLLQAEARGYSLDPLYAKVPDALRGCVELVYDLHGQPSFRFFETLLYQRFYDPSGQSLALWCTNDDERPFVFSTPRLGADDVLHLKIPFARPEIDSLARMRHTPGSVGEIADQLEVAPGRRALFDTFFTDQPSPPVPDYDGARIRMRYFGHACILVETRDVRVLVDPLVSYYGYSHEVPRLTFRDLPQHIDYVLITHNHQDHVLLETLLPLRHRIGKVVVPRSNGGSLQDPNLRVLLNRIGFDDVVELDELQSINDGDLEVTGIPFLGEHGDLDVRSKLCYLLRLAGRSLLFAADSCNVEPRLYQELHRYTDDIDAIFLGMECEGAPVSWIYGPLMTRDFARDRDQSRRLNGSNFERGMALVEAFVAKEVFVYAMGMEPWVEFISSIRYTEQSQPIIASNRLVEECRRRGIVAERLFGEKELFYDRAQRLRPVGRTDESRSCIRTERTP
jgi:L-ascorbate metabolism protein UlaG (beta-lactamase superfamily)